MLRKWINIFILFALCLSIGTASAQSDTERVIVGFKNVPDKALIHAHGGKIAYEYSIIPAIACELPRKAIYALMKNRNLIAYIEPDAKAWALGETMDWGVNRIGADLVWDIDGNLILDAGAPAGAGVKVAVIDTGIDYTHPDLNVAGGDSFVDYTTDYMDDHSHGTHVAGTIAALDNDIGVIGVAPEANLYAVKVLDSSGSGSYSDIIAGIDWAVSNDMDIISMSLGGSTDYIYLQQACDNAYNKGVLVIAAAGNSGSYDGTGDTVLYPARYDSVMAVAATDHYDERASFSSTGPAVEISAPGTYIYSTYPGGTYSYKSGTSMACPHISGIAALMISGNPDISNTEVRTILQQTTEDLGLDPTWQGFGLARADRAVSDSGETGPVAPPLVPVAQFSAAPLTGEAPLPVTFTDASVNAVELHWDFGDGSVSELKNPTHTYQTAGTFTATLSVTAGDGSVDTATSTVTVTELVVPEPKPAIPPQADFKYSPETIKIGTKIRFIDLSSDADGTITSWSWDFGDGTSASSQNPKHAFTAAGTYNVKLVVTDNEGLISEEQQKIIGISEKTRPTKKK
jgi:PKD repeat protein